MAEKGEKFLSFDKFKEQVYKNIGTLESLDDLRPFVWYASNRGCFGFFMGGLGKMANKKTREHLKLEELSAKADEILAQKEIKDLLCEKLDATIILPIDAAYKLTPVLYGLALEDEEKMPFDSMLFAIICRKIVKEGVENFCGQTSTGTEEDKGKKNKAKKPAAEDNSTEGTPSS